MSTKLHAVKISLMRYVPLVPSHFSFILELKLSRTQTCLGPYSQKLNL